MASDEELFHGPSVERERELGTAVNDDTLERLVRRREVRKELRADLRRDAEDEDGTARPGAAHREVGDEARIDDDVRLFEELARGAFLPRLRVIDPT